ncbi:MAG: 23S rRNA (guanosine(2251)-2'-O)-methyltransferase RlmB [Oscillospiraceae bacterium]|nr:23S rRNA (guanosine(2251)-2'-O)-methyltransferase RlmB [Oscillospiraceae bacterium]
MSDDSLKPDTDEGIIEGRNAVTEALRAGRPIDKIYIAKGDVDKTLWNIALKAREAGVVVIETDRRKLDNMCKTAAHQGVIAKAAAREYCTPADILAVAKTRGEVPFVVACDGINDPQNMGAIIRSAECAGVHGVIITKRRSVGLTAAVGRASAGAVEHMAVARVASLPSTLNELKSNGLWIFGTSVTGRHKLWKTDMKGPICLVIGSEGGGMGRLVTKCCDFSVRVPVTGKVASLNASAAAAVTIYEIMRQRG